MSKRKTRLKIRQVIFATVGLIVILLIADFTYYGIALNIGKLENENPRTTAFIQYRIRQWKSQKRNVKIRRKWVPLSQISRSALRAVVVAEDAKFWKHDGFDFEAIRKAMEKNLKEGKVILGASTITQQLAKNLYLSPSKTPVRKINEAILTWRIERTLSKRRILEIYFNVVEWGDGIFGIEAASQYYFHKSSSSLNESEAASLASVLPNPIRFSPVRPSRYVIRRSRAIRRILGGNISAISDLQRSKEDRDDIVKDSVSINDSVIINDSTNNNE